jgi:hypothetical protein
MLPDIRVLPNAVQPVVATSTRELAIARALANYLPQWSFWPLGAGLELSRGSVHSCTKPLSMRWIPRQLCEQVCTASILIMKKCNYGEYCP